jgi:hypothetical protein
MSLLQRKGDVVGECKEMVDIPDNYLIAFLAAVFVPTFVFCIKMIMEVGNIKARFDSIRIEIDLRIKEMCKDIEKAQREIDNLFSRFDYRYGYGSHKEDGSGERK